MFGFLAIFLLMPAAPPAMALESHAVRKVTATYRGEIQILSGKPTEITLYLAHPQELPAQTKVKSVVEEPAGAEVVYDASPLKRPIWKVVVKPTPGQTSIPVRMKIEATLLSRKLIPRTRGFPGARALTDEEREWYLAETKLVDYSSEDFQKWLSTQGLKRKGKEDDFELAQRTFLKLVQLYNYKVTPVAPASKLVGQTLLDCDCLAVIFVSAMRSNGIPSRTLSGFPPKSVVPVNGSLGGHAIAEFYLDGVGWVPCDPASSVDADIKRRNPLSHFGVNNGRLLVFNADGAVHLPGTSTVRNSMTGPHLTWRFKGEKPSVKFVPAGFDYQEVLVGK